MSFSSFKNNFSSGVSYLRRRLSASDLNDEMSEDFQKTIASSQQSPPHSVAQPPLVGSRKGPSAPTSPSTVDSLSSFAKDLAPSKATVDSISSFAKGLLQSATGSTTVSPAHGQQRSPTSHGKDHCKILLVIDDDHTDWSKYFRGKKIFGDWDIRVEQAEFADINLTSHTDNGCIVDIHASRSGSKVVRSFQPDFVLIRQRTRDADINWKNIIVGLYYGGVPGVNSMASLYNFLDKPWVFGHLIQVQKKLGKDILPLIEQSYYPNHKEMICAPTISTVVKIGHAHAGRGKVKADNPIDFQDVASLVAMTGCYATSEPFVDSKCDIHIEKIGDFYKAFARKSMSGNWKANTGSSTIEQVPMTDRYKLWADECSKMFGGLDLCSVEVVQATDGQEYIIEVNDSTMALLGESQDEDKRLIAEHVLQKMEQLCKPVSNIRKMSGSGLSGSALSIHQHTTSSAAAAAESSSMSETNPFSRQIPSTTSRVIPAAPSSTSTSTGNSYSFSTSSSSYQSPPSAPTSYQSMTPYQSASSHQAVQSSYQPAPPPPSSFQSSSSYQSTYSTASSQQQHQPPASTITNPFSAVNQSSPVKPPAPSPQRPTSTTGVTPPAPPVNRPPPIGTAPQNSGAGTRPAGQRPPMPIPSATESLAERATRQQAGQQPPSDQSGRPNGSQRPQRPGMPPSHKSIDSAAAAETDDTMKNLRKTFAGIFSDM